MERPESSTLILLKELCCLKELIGFGTTTNSVGNAENVGSSKMIFQTLREFATYEQQLAAALFAVEDRGFEMDLKRLGTLKLEVESDLVTERGVISKVSGLNIASRKSQIPKDETDWINLGAPEQVKTLLIGCGLKLKKLKGKESTREEVLQQMFSESGHPVLQSVLKVRELNKIRGYLNANLDNGIFYSSFNPAGTVTGRRSSAENFLELGTNQQNIPKHSKLGKRYRRCFVARPGRVFVSCDQKGADDWVVHGYIADVSGITSGIEEMRAGINRHQKLASFIFAFPEDKCGSDTVYYYLGKKTRHAGQYGQRGNTMSLVLAKEGYFYPPKACQDLLDKFHKAEPQIANVYWKYIEETLKRGRTLVTPVGRRRIFFSLRDYSDNSSVYRDGYIYLPQSTVADNTGMAIVWLEDNFPNFVLNETHDSITGEAEDSVDKVNEAIRMLKQSFHRVFTFPNGFQVEIPVSVEIGYNLQDMVKVKDEANLEILQRAKELSLKN